MSIVTIMTMIADTYEYMSIEIEVEGRQHGQLVHCHGTQRVERPNDTSVASAISAISYSNDDTDDDTDDDNDNDSAAPGCWSVEHA